MEAMVGILERTNTYTTFIYIAEKNATKSKVGLDTLETLVSVTIRWRQYCYHFGWLNSWLSILKKTDSSVGGLFILVDLIHWAEPA